MLSQFFILFYLVQKNWSPFMLFDKSVLLAG